MFSVVILLNGKLKQHSFVYEHSISTKNQSRSAGPEAYVVNYFHSLRKQSGVP